MVVLADETKYNFVNEGNKNQTDYGTLNKANVNVFFSVFGLLIKLTTNMIIQFQGALYRNSIKNHKAGYRNGPSHFAKIS